MNDAAIKIDLSERFPPLAHAPIVEAVIEMRARAEAPWDEVDVRGRLQARMPDYPTSKSVRRVAFDLAVQRFRPGEEVGPQTSAGQLHAWLGLKFVSQDELQIATFTRDGFSFSRLPPYPDWHQFSTEALRLWAIHADTARVSQLERLGVRFINRIDAPVDNLRLEEYFQRFSDAPRDLPRSMFLHRDVLAVPGHAYGINVIRTIQVPTQGQPERVGLILDIDVFTTEPLVTRPGIIEDRLAEMRWLKNTLFFGGVTEKALELCR